MSDGNQTVIKFLFEMPAASPLSKNEDLGKLFGIDLEQAPPPRTEAPDYAPRKESNSGADFAITHQKRSVSDKLKRSVKSSGRRWRLIGRAARGLLRGTAFAQQGSMAGAGIAAWEFGQAGGSLLSLAGGSGIAAGIGAVAGPFAAAAAAVGAFAVAVKASSDALEGMANRARAFSGEVAIAFAERDVKRLLFEIEQAQKYGAIESAGVRARTELDIEWDRLMDKWKASFGEVATNMIVKPLADFLKEFNEWMGLRKKDDEAGKELQLKQMAGLELLRGVIQDLAQVTGDGNPAAEWMKSTPHFELRDVGMANGAGGFVENARLAFDPFLGGVAP